MDFIIGIDIGTGSTKAVAIDLKSSVLASAQIHYPTLSPSPGYSEQDPEEIWQAFRSCIIQVAGSVKGRLLGLSLSSAMHSLIPLGARGEILNPAIIWSDTRSSVIAAALRASDQSDDIYTISGMPIHAMSPLCKIMWLRQHHPVLFGKAVRFVSVKEYIWSRIFGEYQIDYSMAAATGMLDVQKLQWSAALVSLAGIHEGQLSDIVPCTYQRLMPDSGLFEGAVPEGASFFIGGSDGCMANIGTRATEAGVAALTIGTSGAVRLASKKPLFNREAMTFSYAISKKLFICGGPVNNGGNVLNWFLEKFWSPELTTAVFDDFFARIAEMPPGAEGLIFLPYLNGERAPVWDERASGVFLGLKSRHGKELLGRAVVEGICFALADVVRAVGTSMPIEQINVSGGFIHSKVWMQILADVIGKKLALVQAEDASAVGAAFLAMEALGVDLPASDEEVHLVIPDLENHRLYSERFAVYRSLYSTLSPAMHKLHQLNS